MQQSDDTATQQVVDALNAQRGAPQYVLRERLAKELESIPHPFLKQAMMQTFAEMLQGSSPGFQLLRGAVALPVSLAAVRSSCCSDVRTGWQD